MYRKYQQKPRYELWDKYLPIRELGTTTTVIEWLKFINDKNTAIVVYNYSLAERIEKEYKIKSFFWLESYPRESFLIFDNVIGVQEKKSRKYLHEYHCLLQTSKFKLEIV